MIRDRGSVLRASTRTESRNVLSLVPEWRGLQVIEPCQLGVHFVYIGLRPANGGHFDLAVACYVEQGRDIGESVDVRDGIVVRSIIDGYRECHAVFAREGFSFGSTILADAEKRDLAVLVSSPQTFVQRKSELTNRAGNFEECQDNCTVLQQVLQTNCLTVSGLQPERGGKFTGYKCGHAHRSPMDLQA